MTRQEALKYLMFERKVSIKSNTKYGATPIARSVAAWAMALKLCDNDVSKVDTLLLDQIIEAIENGENVIEILLNGKVEDLKG